MTGVTELVEWLRAQLDEDERVAREALHRQATTRRMIGRRMIEETIQPIAAWRTSVWPPARVLAEVDAKRRILDQCAGLADMGFVGSAWTPGDMSELAAQALSLLALPYADRPGYRDEWRPAD
jgi:hypothetical protein